MSSVRPLNLITDPHLDLGMTVPKWKRTPGTLGIFNHGNSCFMNAILQCLSNTDSFTEYFVKDFYKIALKNNKSGKKSVFRNSTHGEVTEALGTLLKSIWSGNYQSNISKEFKSVVGKLCNQYKGDYQHDAQEFLLWLLDHVHEDVSAFTKKKKSTQLSFPGKAEEDGATNIKSESLVVKLFQALHASTLTCPTCGRQSSTLNPDFCVSLPLPQSCPRSLTVVMMPFDPCESGVTKLKNGAAGLRLSVTLNQMDTVAELKAMLCSESTGLCDMPSRLILVQLRDDGFGLTYSDEQLLSDIVDDGSLYAVEGFGTADDDNISHDRFGKCDREAVYEGNGPSNRRREYGTPMVDIMLVHVELSPGSNKSHRFGNPCMLRVRRDITWKGLQKEILLKMGDSVYDGVISQFVNDLHTLKLGALFKLRLYDGSCKRNSLSSDVEMPLYTQDVERAYETLDEDFGPLHIKLIVEWESKTKKGVVADSREYIQIHTSVHDALNSSPAQVKVSLDECFKLYTQEEKLVGENAWVCPHCKQYQQGTIKTLGMRSLPDILVLHLKRFKQNGLCRSKLNTLVDFPIEGLDMSPYLSHQNNNKGADRISSSSGRTIPLSYNVDDYTYDLLGVSNHYGNMSGGHYIAVCKNPVDGVWREFNDQQVHVLQDGDSIITKEAYVLFYQRRSLGKSINHRLFTGDHWAFTLSLAPSEVIERDSQSGESTPREGFSSLPVASSATLPSRRRRSVSPSAAKRSSKEQSISRRSASRPLTPQPRKAVSPDDAKPSDNDIDGEKSEDESYKSSLGERSPRKSRPVHRQVSEPGPRRVKLSNGVAAVRNTKLTAASNTEQRKHYTWEEGSDDGCKVTDTWQTKDHIDDLNFDFNDKDQTSDKSKYHAPTDVLHSINYHRPHLSSGSVEHDLRSSKTMENLGSNLRRRPSFELASSLQVKLDELNFNSSSFPDELLPNTATARQKLAGRIDKEKLEDMYTRNGINLPKSGFRYKMQDDLSRQNVLNKDLIAQPISLQYISHHNHQNRSALDFDKCKAVDQGRWDKPSHLNTKNRVLNGYSELEFDLEDEIEEEEEFVVDKPLKSSNLRSRISDKIDTVRGLAEKHFGPAPIDSRKPVALKPEDDEKYISSLSDPLSLVQSGRVFSRTPSDLQALHNRKMPRSYTDNSIGHGLLPETVDLAAPPSPTPLRGLAEELYEPSINKIIGRHSSQERLESVTFSTVPSLYTVSSGSAGRISARALQAMNAYEHAGRSVGSRTLPGYMSDSGIGSSSRHYFRPPRGTWGIPRVKENIPTATNIPTPCLRESSV